MTKDDDPTPLAILLQSMRQKWAAGDHDGAVAIARAAAPYLHPRHPTASHVTQELHRLSDAELVSSLAVAETRAAAPQSDPPEPDRMGD